MRWIVFKTLVVPLEIVQYSQEKICIGVFFNKVAGPTTCNFI